MPDMPGRERYNRRAIRVLAIRERKEGRVMDVQPATDEQIDRWNEINDLVHMQLTSSEIDQLMARVNAEIASRKAAEKRVAEWQPIATAPKDESQILVWDGDEVEKVYWSKYAE